MSRVRRYGMLALVLAFAGCGEADPTGPRLDAPQASLNGSSGLQMVSWNQPRTSDATVTRRIGLLGGVVSTGGVTLIVPPLALTKTTTITLTVPAGEYVMADLQPHGLQFRLEPLLQFPLLGTDAGLLGSLIGVYAEQDPVGGLIQPTETYPLSVLGLQLSFRINHFSKYAPARGGWILVGG